MKKKNFLMAVIFMATALLTTSCLNDDDAVDNNDYTLYGYCTIGGTNPNYKFYFDGAGVVTPSASSVTTATNGQGFNATRAYMYLTYKGKNYTTTSSGEIQITEAEIQDGIKVPVLKLLTKSEADADSVTANDSIFTVSSIDNVWAYRGYLTTIVTGPYASNTSGALYAHVYLVYNPEDVTENAIKFHIYYNARKTEGTTMSGYTYSFATSYPLYYLANIVPGTGDITMTFEADGVDSASIKVTRDNLTPPSDVTNTGAE